jgi:hypothetical protein
MSLPVRAALVLTLVLAAGCSLVHPRKPAAPELPPGAGIQVEFHDRWIDRRTHELMAANPALTPAEAAQMAATEFAKQYPYVTVPETKTGH